MAVVGTQVFDVLFAERQVGEFLLDLIEDYLGRIR